MVERRRFERFQLSLPARMETITSQKKQVFEFETRDISAAGAFVYTSEPFSLGTRFGLELITRSSRIKELTGAQSLIESEGSIVRSTDKGVAICFDKECQILTLKRL
jgi:c-di-GMP-binding flagellar brake protein YcgR